MRSEKPDRWGKTEGKREGKVVTGKKKKNLTSLISKDQTKMCFDCF